MVCCERYLGKAPVSDKLVIKDTQSLVLRSEECPIQKLMGCVLNAFEEKELSEVERKKLENLFPAGNSSSVRNGEIQPGQVSSRGGKRINRIIVSYRDIRVSCFALKQPPNPQVVGGLPSSSTSFCKNWCWTQED